MIGFLKKGDEIIIKPIFQLLEEGWEPVVWGWIKNKCNNETMPVWHNEINYYNGIEDILDEHRILTVVHDDETEEGIHCAETDYHLARETIGMVLSREDVLAKAGEVMGT